MIIANTVTQLQRGKMNRRFIQLVFQFILFSYLKILLSSPCITCVQYREGYHDAFGEIS